MAKYTGLTVHSGCDYGGDIYGRGVRVVALKSQCQLFTVDNH